MAMRNFWIESDIDGRETILSGEPRRKDGGMRTDIYMRDEGYSVKACTVKCFERDGILAVEVYDDESNLVYCKTTAR